MSFLAPRGSLMLDVVFLAMLLVVPVLLWSIWQVRGRQRYSLHRQLQLLLAMLLMGTVLAFEIDMRFFTDWESEAVGSPYYSTESWNGVWTALTVHLCFAVPTLVIWVLVVVRALRGFEKPPSPGKHSASHKRWGRIAVVGMSGTAVSGWIFYWMAFVATKP
tara:strand:- start:348 stop:833 length:486 start_codon:yes stop_codon:yes gene_type:complete